MVKNLLRAGYEVVIIDNLSTGHRELLLGGTFFEGNLGNGKFLDRIFSEYQISAVMHFAAFSLVGDSMQDPIAYYRNNISGTIELLAAMVRHNVKYFIFSSSAAVYGEPVEIPIKEDHPCNPTNPYGATKVAVEKLLNDCDYAYGLKSVSLRYFNAAGADESGEIGELHEPETHLIPLVLKVALAEKKNIKIFGTDYPTYDGTCVRDYIHVNDLAQAHLLALEALLSGKESSVYNLGNNKGYSVREVIELSEKITKKTIRTVEAKRRPGDPAELIAGSDKIREELGWKPGYEDLETIITTAWNWHTAKKL